MIQFYGFHAGKYTIVPDEWYGFLDFFSWAFRYDRPPWGSYSYRFGRFVGGGGKQQKHGDFFHLNLGTVGETNPWKSWSFSIMVWGGLVDFFHFWAIWMSRWKEGSDRIKGDRISGVTAIIYHHLPLYLLLFFFRMEQWYMIFTVLGSNQLPKRKNDQTCKNIFTTKLKTRRMELK